MNKSAPTIRNAIARLNWQSVSTNNKDQHHIFNFMWRWHSSFVMLWLDTSTIVPQLFHWPLSLCIIKYVPAPAVAHEKMVSRFLSLEPNDWVNHVPNRSTHSKKNTTWQWTMALSVFLYSKATRTKMKIVTASRILAPNVCLCQQVTRKVLRK